MLSDSGVTARTSSSWRKAAGRGASQGGHASCTAKMSARGYQTFAMQAMAGSNAPLGEITNHQNIRCGIDLHALRTSRFSLRPFDLLFYVKKQDWGDFKSACEAFRTLRAGQAAFTLSISSSGRN